MISLYGLSNSPYSFASTSHFVLTFALSFTIVLGATILGFQKHGLKFFSLLVPAGCPLALLPLLVFVFCFGFIYITSVILLEKKNNNSKFVSFLNALVLTTFLYVSFIKVMGFSRFDYIFDGIKFINNYVIILLYGLITLLSSVSNIILSFTTLLISSFNFLFSLSRIDFSILFEYLIPNIKIIIKQSIYYSINLVKLVINTVRNFNNPIRILNCSFNC